MTTDNTWVFPSWDPPFRKGGTRNGSGGYSQSLSGKVEKYDFSPPLVYFRSFFLHVWRVPAACLVVRAVFGGYPQYVWRGLAECFQGSPQCFWGFLQVFLGVPAAFFGLFVTKFWSHAEKEMCVGDGRDRRFTNSTENDDEECLNSISAGVVWKPGIASREALGVKSWEPQDENQPESLRLCQLTLCLWEGSGAFFYFCFCSGVGKRCPQSAIGLFSRKRG